MNFSQNIASHDFFGSFFIGKKNKRKYKHYGTGYARFRSWKKIPTNSPTNHSLNMNVNITDYIPQRPPMVMIDEILISDKNVTKTKFEIKAENIFIENEILSAPGLVENMAQTAAARAGHQFITQNEAVRLGFIGGIKHLKILKFPPIGAVLETEIRELGMIMNISSIKANIRLNGEEIASCEMKIFISEKS